MNSSRDDSSIEDIYLFNNSSYTMKGDVCISEHLADFERMRISALTKAAVMSPLVKEVTIGPNSPIKKELPDKVEPVKEEIIRLETLVEDKLRNDLRYTLILKEFEAKLQEASETIFKGLVEQMVEKRTETIDRFRRKQTEECKRKILETRKLQLLKEMQANNNCAILERARLDQQKSQQLHQQRLENMNRVLEEQNIATARFAAITDSHTKICISYNEIVNILNTDPYSKQIFNKYVPAINSVVTGIGGIMDLCNSDQTSDKEVEQAAVLAANISYLRSKIIKDVNELKQEDILRKNAEEEALKQKEELKKAAQQKAQAELAQAELAQAELAQAGLAQAGLAQAGLAQAGLAQAGLAQAGLAQAGLAQTAAAKAVPLFYSSKNYNYFKELSLFLEQYEGQYKELLENVNWKKFRFDCQKAVNTPVNSLSSVSGMHIRDKYDKLSKLLRGEKVQVLDIHVTATQHPHGLAYCTALLAKKIVRQGDLLVSSNPEAAFPLAALTAALWAQFPDFGKLLEAYFHKLCPYLVPMFLPQKEGQSDKEFYLSRGYTYSEEGVVEKQDKFLKRMSGIFTLRCAIWIATTPKFINAPNPHGPQFGWQWLASFLNLRPEPDICATLLHDFFTVCGSEFYKYYGRQFFKIIKLMNSQYMVVLQNIDEGGPKIRLEVFLQNVLSSGSMPPPTGLLNPNTW